MEIKDSDSIGSADSIKIIFGGKCIESYLGNERSLNFTFSEVMKIALENGYEREDTILLIAESPLSGDIYQYGNYGEYWVEHGSTRGYA